MWRLRGIGILLLGMTALRAQVAITARVVDENGVAVPGARVILRLAGSETLVVGGTDLAGNVRLNLPAAGEYALRVERLGFYLYQGAAQRLEGESELIITLNHLQEFSDRIDVTYSPPAIDPSEPAERKELDNTEILTVPYPAPQDYRNALPMMPGVVQDNAGRAHFNGGQISQTNYNLNGFDISDPVTGRIETRVNIESIQAIDVATSRFSAANGRGSAGVVNLETRMGDDRFRFSGTNFVPSVGTDGGWRVSQWTPRLALSGPLMKGRAWFHNGIDLFYSNDVVRDLPRDQNRTLGYTASDLSRFHINLSRTQSLTASFLWNGGRTRRSGLSFVNPAEATTNRDGSVYMSTLRHQTYFWRGALLDLGFADSRGTMSELPQGRDLFQITPAGNRGNFFVGVDRHYYRQQWLANIFLPAIRLLGTHQLRFGVDFEREAYHQKTERHAYQVVRDDDTVARHVTFAGSPFQARKNLEGAHYVQDAWKPRETLAVEAGLRFEWNQIVRDLLVAPRLAAAWSPKALRDTKLAAGWGIYYDAMPLNLIARSQDQTSYAMYFSPGKPEAGPFATWFFVDDSLLRAPRYHTISFSVERRLPGDFQLKTGYTRRLGNRGFLFAPMVAIDAQAATYQLGNWRLERYDAVEISLRRTFAGRFEWFGAYTRSSARSNAAVDYSLENPVFGPQSKGPFPWDTPHRIQMWGWLPVPVRILPARFRFVTRNTTAAYLVEYRTGFPFSVVTEEGSLAGNPNSRRMPDYRSFNLHLERQFRALHYLWAWRFGFNNLTNNPNPNTVNNVTGTPQFLTYGRGQGRAFSVRLRFLGRK